MHYFLQSILIGFSLASVVGPISILCVKQTIVNGYKAGFVATLGASTADTFYAAVAAYGLTMISGFLIEYQFFLRVVGGLFLLYLGIQTIMSKIPKTAEVKIKKHNLLANYFTIVALTIANPLTIILFLSIFAGFGFAQGQDIEPFFVTVGIGIGSVLAYVVLILIAAILKKKASDKALKNIHTVSGAMLICFALYSFFGAFSY